MKARPSMTFRHVAPHASLREIHYTITAEQSDDGTWLVYGLAYGYATAYPVSYLEPTHYATLDEATAHITTNAVATLTAGIGQAIDRAVELPFRPDAIVKRKARYEYELSQAALFD